MWKVCCFYWTGEWFAINLVNHFFILYTLSDTKINIYFYIFKIILLKFSKTYYLFILNFINIKNLEVTDINRIFAVSI